MTDPDERPVDVVRVYCDARSAGDAMTVLGLYHEDLTLEWFGRHRLAGTHVGLDASVAALLELQAVTNRVPLAIVQILEADDRIVAIVDERWTRTDPDAAVLDHTRALEYTVADGLLRTCRVFETAQRDIDEWVESSGPAALTT